MATKPQNPTVTLDRERAKIEEFFHTSLERLNLTKTQIGAQSQKELENSLATVEDAIRNPSAFGTLKIAMSAEGVAFIVRSKSEHLFDVGILPLLLESKTLILTRLAEFGGDLAQTERELHDRRVQTLIRRIRTLDIAWRVLVGIILWFTLFFAILKAPTGFSWTWWTEHPKFTALTSIAVIAATGLIWSVLETSKSRRWFAIGSVVLAAIIAGITVI